MNEERIKQLERFIQEDPNDPFLKYALATEYLKNNKRKSAELFEDLLKTHPDYIATYYHAAALFTEFGEMEKAENIYTSGIQKAQALNESHALKELQSAYINFQFENE
ncbi:tetratricopeptide repeat protein [Marinoscillum sp. MHG1-6]|uniref:tetratricopeptide repeat protein n=1 Tax=Marinoscillum sp. MHG1-6 TaxID=2959627 RepID=UPI002157845F|nr:tetratricopeptide repeat protein [Marinoscillum sp. MHG1-6]